MSSENRSKKDDCLWEEEISFSRKLIVAFQHVLTMCPGSIVVPLILGSALNLDAQTTAFLVAANLFTSGIAVLINIIGIGPSIGSRLPVILGSSFVPLGAMILIGQQYGLRTVFGAIIGSAVLMFILSFFMHKIMKFFPKVVVGSFVTLIGISLAPVAIKDIGGGQFSPNYGAPENLILGFLVLIIIILVGKFGKGLMKTMSLLIGILAGTAIAYPLNMLNIEPVLEAKWFQFVNPFAFGTPEFKINAIIIMTLFCIINIIQCIGVFSVLDEVVGTETGDEDKIKGIRAQIVAQGISGIFNSIPSTMFNENIGLINLTRVKDNSVIKIAGLMLILLGVFPKFAAIITIIPKPVIGGATLALFGIITSAGISILSSLDFSKDNNFTIVGTSIAIGVGATFAQGLFAKLPGVLGMLLSQGLFMVTISAILLNIVLNRKPKNSIEST